VPVHQVAALLGHSTPVTTHATYSHVIDGAGEAVARVMSDILDGDQAMDDTGVRTRSTHA
jgi:integrase